MAARRSSREGGLEKKLAGIDPRRLRSVLTKDARIEIRTTTPEKAEIERAAKACKLTVTEYLVQLHRIAARKLGRGRRP